MADNPDYVRRGLLTGAPLLGVSLLLAEDAEGADAPPPEAQDPRVPIFHETDHVRTFYRLARD